ncbi:MAG: hypothetical protein GY941_29190, partial [Planctomycetes bacterium]|nr:hypothetical protein [Planctomycetota bacterium]
MFNTMKNKLLVCLSLFFLIILLAPRTASSVTIPISSLVPGVGIGDGLVGEFYDSNVTSNIAADSFIGSHSPSASFVSTLMDYPNGSGGTTLNTQSVGTFLGIDDPGITTPLGSSIFLFSGFIEIDKTFDETPTTAPVDVSFAIRSDDGMRLKIGGITVTEFTSPRQFSDTPTIITASFDQAGLYPVEILYWNMSAGNRGAIEWYTSIPGGPANTSSNIPNGGIVPTSILSTTACYLDPKFNQTYSWGVGSPYY